MSNVFDSHNSLFSFKHKTKAFKKNKNGLPPPGGEFNTCIL